MDISWLIDKMLTGKAGAHEIIEVKKWIAQSESNRIEFETLKLLYESPQRPNEPGQDFREGLFKIKAIIEMKRRTSKANMLRRKYTVTAILLLFFGALSYPAIQNMRSDAPAVDLTFHNERLESIVTILEKEYNVHVQVERSEVEACRFSGTFSKTNTIEEIIKTLASAMNLRYEVMASGVYLLKGYGCSQ